MISDILTPLIDRRDGHAATEGLVKYGADSDLSQEAAQLRHALVSNRRISMAMGILMRDRNLDEDEAFIALRRISQDSNRKLRDVAEDVIHHRRLPPATRRAERLPVLNPSALGQTKAGRSPF